MIDIKIKKLHPDAIMPTYATAGSACFDLHSLENSYIDDIGHSSEIIRTGLSFEIPPYYVMLIFSRSGHGFKHNVRLANCVGVIDSDYRGEVLIKLTTDDFAALPIKKGDRIAQALVIPYPQINLIETDVLTPTQRGRGGFGSTGA